MSVVVTDASPLNYLIQIEAVHALAAIFGEVIVPSAVVEELRHARAPAIVQMWACRLPAWISVKNASEVLDFGTILGIGESHALSLAYELKASLVLVDDRAARRIATERGLSVLGTIGLLERADENNLLDLRISLQKLLRTNFRIDARAVAEVLARSTQRKTHRSP